MNKRIDVVLTDNELEFLEKLAERDSFNRGYKMTVKEEMRSLFYLQLREEMELYEDELRGEQ